MFAKSKIDRESDSRKFEDLLKQVKSIKNERLTMSVSWSYPSTLN